MFIIINFCVIISSALPLGLILPIGMVFYSSGFNSALEQSITDTFITMLMRYPWIASISVVASIIAYAIGRLRLAYIVLLTGPVVAYIFIALLFVAAVVV